MHRARGQYQPKKVYEHAARGRPDGGGVGCTRESMMSGTQLRRGGGDRSHQAVLASRGGSKRTTLSSRADQLARSHVDHHVGEVRRVQRAITTDWFQ